MGSEAAALIMRLQSFWTWWTSALSSLLPAGIKKILLRRKSENWLVANENHVALHTTDEAGRPLTIMNPADIAVMVNDWESLSILVPRELCLQKTVSYPAAVKGELATIISHDVPKHFPFQSGQVVFGYSVLERAEAKFRVLVGICPKHTYTEYRKMFMEQFPGKRLGFALEVDEAYGAHGKLWVEGSKKHPASVNGPPKRLAIIGLAAALAAVVAGIFFWVDRVEAQQALNAALVEADRVMPQVQRRFQMQSDNQQIEAGSSGDQSSMALLALVTDTLPDHTHLTEYRVADGQLSLSGLSHDAASLIELLESTQSLSEVRFSSPVRRDASRNADVFQITATLSGGGDDG